MITCEEFFAEFADYMEDQVSPEIRKELESALVPMPRLPSTLRYQPQDRQNRN